MINIVASILDFPHPGLDGNVWSQEAILLPEHKKFILSNVEAMLEELPFKNPHDWIDNIIIVGSLTTFQWNQSSDLDIHISSNPEKFSKSEGRTVSAQEFQDELDAFRKVWDKEHRLILPNTKHLLELYLQTPASSKDIEYTGIYDVQNDEWIKPPKSVRSDYDIEELKPKFVEMARDIASDMDVSFGTIKQDVKRIEELQEVIKAWSNDGKKQFKKKLDEKLESIEHEIEDMLKTRQEIVDERHIKKFDPESEQEIKFKYLQKFSYMYILSQLKDFLKEEGEITEQNVEEIKEIVENCEEKTAAIHPDDPGVGKLMIDFDQTIAKNDSNYNSVTPMKGAKEALEQLKAAGWKIIVYSGKADTPEGADEIRQFMKEHEIPYDDIFIGKPQADFYIDDKNIVFTNWKDVVETVEHSKTDKTAQQDTQYDYSSTQFNMPKDITQSILEWSVKNIPNEDLYDDDTKRYGRELESHVTLLYGLTTNDSTEVEKLLSDELPIRIKFGKTRHFNTQTGDAVNIEIESEDLQRLHDKLSKLDHVDTQDEYHPHITIAYVKDGLGHKYSGDDFLEDLEIELDTVKFSPKKGDPVFVNLGKKAKKEASHVTNGSWISPDGIEYDLERGEMHVEWIHANRDLLENQYHFDFNVIDEADYVAQYEADNYAHEDAVIYEKMIKNGWTRTSVDQSGVQFMIHVDNLKHLPQSAISFIERNFDPNDESPIRIVSETKSALIEDPFPNVQRAVLDSLRVPFALAASLKTAKVYWFTPEGQIKSDFTIDPKKSEEFLEKGWFVVDDQNGKVTIYVDDFEFIPDQLNEFLADIAVPRTTIYITDKLGHTIDIRYPVKDIKKIVMRKLYAPEMAAKKEGDFSPSIALSPPDNPWQTDSDVQIPVDPNTIDDEPNYFAPHADKPRDRSWIRKIIDWFKDKPKEQEKNADVLTRGTGWWIDSNGKIIKLKDGQSHREWVAENLPNEDYDTLINKGWTRVRDQDGEVYVSLADINNISPSLDNLLSNFSHDFVFIEDIVGNVKTATLNTNADVITDILGLVKSTGGATYNVLKGNLAGTENYAVSIYPEHTSIIDHELTPHDLYTYMTSKKDLLTKLENSFGIWKSGDKYYLDVVVTIPDREKAIELGRRHNQISIFNLKDMTEIPTGGTGEVQSKKAFFLGLSKRAYVGRSSWVDPNGIVYEFPVEKTHSQWIRDNRKLLESKYKYDVTLGDDLFYTLLKSGWVRVNGYSGSFGRGYTEFSIQVNDLLNPPKSLQDFLDQYYDWNSNNPILMDDMSDRHAEVDITGDVREDIRRDLALQRRKVATQEIKYNVGDLIFDRKNNKPGKIISIDGETVILEEISNE